MPCQHCQELKKKHQMGAEKTNQGYTTEKRKEAAKKIKLTKEQRSENAKKAWEKRRAT